MTPRRVLHIIDSLHLGGAQEVVLNIATCGSERFHHEVATLHGHGVYWDRLQQAGIKVFSLSPHKFLPLYLATIPWRLLLGHYDILHCHLIPSNIIAKPIGALCGVPVIINHDHTNDTHRAENKLLLSLDRATNRLASHIIPVSASCRDFLIQYESIPPNKITLIPNAIDLRRFTSGGETRAAARRSLHIPTDGFLVAGVGRLNPQKNFMLFLEIAKRLLTQFTNLHFLLAGEGPEENLLREKAASMGISNKITFSGYIADTRRVYTAADVLLMPSRFEGLPMTLLESMAMGLPVVASNLDGIAEVIQHAEDGYLSPSNSAETFAQHIALLLSNPDQARRIAINARAKIEKHFSVERLTSQVEAIYDRFLP